ncbi:hypothetical protein SAMN06295885_0309 [Rathayibacter oskolensis]|uniref:Uncharacterized protein n=1 Tax=Rathayibacter oskolensis TaxID=1891671 RepID=A0A1X7MYC6_9MICO|nr:hypothetical protein [Rathayibacter oskolensis]SMH29443.1 hypothetical protein SAMN06295885_0309 [Rathayibacter oskolensis]
MTSSDSALSRRSLVSAGAWTAPAIAVAVAAPLAAASGEPVPEAERWENNLFPQFALGSSDLVWARTTVNVLGQGPKQVRLFNYSSAEDVPAAGATITIRVRQTSGPTFPADSLVVSSLTGPIGAVGIGTSSVSFVNPQPIARDGGSAVFPITFRVPTGTAGVGAATGWEMTISSSAGDGTYTQGKLGAWSGASTL